MSTSFFTFLANFEKCVTVQEETERSMDDVMIQKAELRKQMLKRRDGLGKDYCMDSDRRILERVLEMKEYRQADVIFTYVSIEGEVDTRGLILQALNHGKQVAVPRCGKSGIMKAYGIENMGELEPGIHGILEPVKWCQEVQAEDMGLVLVPCVCCSEAGVRLGYGGGYYDRYLPRTLAPAAALCREEMMAQRVPGEEHDWVMDFVVTEKRVINVQKNRAASPGG